MSKTTGFKKELSPEQFNDLIAILKVRFESHKSRHDGLDWSHLESKLKACHTGKRSDRVKLWSLSEMERTGGEPDVTGYDKHMGDYIFIDCSAETPSGRRSLCYDHEALESRKENKPISSALDMAEEMEIELLDEEQYRELQQLGNFDLKTSSWVKTPAIIRKLGGALFCDLRYDHVFVYHNGAQSYYAVRGFRGTLRI